MYIGRASHQNDLIPGKVLINNHCHVSYDGVEHSISTFEVLLNANFQWIQSSNGHVPQNAVVGGRTSSGEQLYVGRASHCGVITPGKVHASHGCIYIPFAWKEHRVTNYEVLVNNNSSGWCPPPVQPPVVCPPPIQPPNCNPGCNCGKGKCKCKSKGKDKGKGKGKGKGRRSSSSCSD